MIEGLSHWQSVILLVVLSFSSILSIIGSVIISISIIRRRGKQQQQLLQNEPLFQLLLGLSLGDFLSTIALALGPYLTSHETTTCSFGAFFHIFGWTMSSFYNCWISIHFWRIVQENSKTTGQNLQINQEKCFQLFSHILAIFTPLIIASLGLITNTFHPHDFLGICYFGDQPTGCTKQAMEEEEECQHSDGIIYGRISVGIITVLAMLSIGFAISLTRKVRASFRRSDRFSMRNLNAGIPSAHQDGSNNTASTMGTTTTNTNTTTNATTPTTTKTTATKTTTIKSASERNLLNQPSTRTSLGSTTSTPRSQLMKKMSSIQRISMSNFGTSIHDMLEDTRQREVAIQALWYMLAYLNTFLLPLITMIVLNTTSITTTTSNDNDADEQAGSAGYYILLLCLYFFMPLQGALNGAVFIRPRYIAWKGYLEKQKQQQHSTTITTNNNARITTTRTTTTRPSMEQPATAASTSTPTPNQANSTTPCPPWYTILSKAVLQDVPSSRWQRRQRKHHHQQQYHQHHYQHYQQQQQQQQAGEQLGCGPATPSIPILDELQPEPEPDQQQQGEGEGGGYEDVLVAMASSSAESASTDNHEDGDDYQDEKAAPRTTASLSSKSLFMSTRLAALSTTSLPADKKEKQKQKQKRPSMSSRFAALSTRPLPGSSSHTASEKFYSAYLSTCFSLGDDLDDDDDDDDDCGSFAIASASDDGMEQVVDVDVVVNVVAERDDDDVFLSEEIQEEEEDEEEEKVMDELES